MVYSFFLDDLHDLWKLRAQGWLSTCDLETVSRNRSLSLESADHFTNLVHAGLVDVCSFETLLHVEEAVPAREIATIGDYNVGKTSVAQVIRAEAAVCRTGATLYGNVGS